MWIWNPNPPTRQYSCFRSTIITPAEDNINWILYAFPSIFCVSPVVFLHYAPPKDSRYSILSVIMPPFADYVNLSIETFVNTVSLVVMAPLVMTLVKTQGMHGNCKWGWYTILWWTNNICWCINFFTLHCKSSSIWQWAYFIAYNQHFFSFNEYILSLVSKRGETAGWQAILHLFVLALNMLYPWLKREKGYYKSR